MANNLEYAAELENYLKPSLNVHNIIHKPERTKKKENFRNVWI